MSSGNSVDCGEILLADSREEADFVVLWSFSRSLSADTAFLSSWTVNVWAYIYHDSPFHLPYYHYSGLRKNFWWIWMNMASLHSSAICSPLRGLKGLNFSSSWTPLLTVTHLSLWPTGPKKTSSSSSSSALISLIRKKEKKHYVLLYGEVVLRYIWVFWLVFDWSRFCKKGHYPCTFICESWKIQNKQLWSKCHAINFLSIFLAWAILGNIGPNR